MKQYLLKTLLALVMVGSLNTQSVAGQAIPESAPVARTHAQGRQHPAYQVFASQARLPRIIIVTERLIVIQGGVKIDTRGIGRANRYLRLSIASAMGVPVGVIDRWVAKLARIYRPSAEALALDLRTTVIDYRYLADRLGRYLPPAGYEGLKATALNSLRAGDLDTVWEMYCTLPRPSAPTL